MFIFYKENNSSWLEFHIRINPIPDMFTLGMKIIVYILDKQTVLWHYPQEVRVKWKVALRAVAIQQELLM